MKLEEIIEQIKDLKESFKNGKSLNCYAQEKHISRLYLTSLLTKDVELLDLAEAYCILDICPDYYSDIPIDVLYADIQSLLIFKKVFEKGLL